ncbi:MAG TPA: carboxypeptidase regulatory-like domain-containing protein [Granulicella sp.]
MLLAAIVVLLCLSGAGWAQGPNATVTGVVTDSSGAIVPGAHITITNVATNVSSQGATNNSGEYTIPLLPPGQYKILVSAAGFKEIVQTGVTLQVAQTARLDFKAELGEVTQTVQVTGEPPLTQTEDASEGSVIENKQVQELPLNGRQYYSLAYLTPGTYKPTQNSGTGYRGGFNVAGSSDTSNNYTLDGFDNNDLSINTPTYLPSVDQIQEFKLLTGVYSAQYGRNSGGQLLVTTKSGTNGFHGTLFEYLRNQIFDAENYFTPEGKKPSFKRNQFGGTLGGPIVKDKTFFFFSYEGLRLRQEFIALATVPTVKMRQGDFSELLAVRSKANPNGIQLKNPLTGAIIPNNNIAGMENAVGAALQAYYPTPTVATPAGSLPSNNFNFDENRTETMNEYGIRVDHTFGPSDSVYAVFNRYSDPSFEPSNSTCGSRVLPGFGCNVGVTGYVAGFSYTHTFGPSVINVVRGNWNQYAQPRTQQDPTNNFDERFNFPLAQTDLPNIGGVPQTSVTGFSTLGDGGSLPQSRTDLTYYATDNLTILRGPHTINVGGSYLRFMVSDYFVSNGRGSFNFTGSSTAPTSGYTGADLLLGVPTSTSITPEAPKFYPRENIVSVYAQDDWKITPRFTANIGVRYEYNGVLSEKYHNIATFDPASSAVLKVGQGGLDKIYNTQHLNFAPRVGFSWQPFNNKNTVVRAGAGFFFDNADKGNSVLSIFNNFPMRNPETFNASIATPISLTNPFPTALAAGSSTPAGVVRDFKTANLQEYSIGVQRQLSETMLLDVAYFGAQGIHLPSVYNINQPAPAPSPISTAQINARRPFQGYSNISYTHTNGVSSYNSLQVKLEKRASHGLLFIGAYTYGHSLDTVSGSVQNMYNVASNLGNSSFDVRHNFTFSPVYELPFGKDKPWLQNGIPAVLAGGWQVTGIVALQSGNPVTAIYTTNISNTLNNEDRPNVIDNPNAGPKTIHEWFNTAAFVSPASGTFGNESTGAIYGPGSVNVDFAAAKKFPVIPERVNAEFRGELFNAFNHPNFLNPSLDPGSASFGTITGANSPRNIEFALRLMF